MTDWATSNRTASVDLLIDLAARRTRSGLEEALRDAVRDGRLAPGTRLPSSRVLARDLGLARNTVADAYGQLVAEGWLTARQGSGTSVAPRPVAPRPRPHPRPGRHPGPPGQAGHPGRGGHHQAPAAKPADPATPTGVVPHATRLPYILWAGSPDLSAFPRTAWSAAARRALAAAPNEAFGYSDPRGRPELRAALAGYLARVRGVRTDPELLVICTGYVQAVNLLARALHGRGARRIAVESVGLPDSRTQLRAAGLDVVTLPVDAHGARVDGLTGGPAAGGRGVAAVLLTPAHQFPMGVPLSPERRTAVVAWARATGAVVVEDDYDGEFRYDRQPVGALQGLAPEHVAYAGTASKSLAPALRLAWLAVPPHLLDALVREKRLADQQSPVLEQLTLAQFIGSGGYDRHVRRMRLRYRDRRDRLVATLAERVPDAKVSGIAAGLHVLLELPPRAGSAEAVVARARERGLALHGLPTFGAPPTAPPALVIGYGTPPEHAFSTAVDLLCEVLTHPPA